jgi:hypothetical protein
MQMLYDSESFVVMHLQADALGQVQVQDVVSTQHPEDAVPAQAQDSLAVQSASFRLARHGFEIVDKRSGKEVYLDGSWAELFQQQIVAWQIKTPTQEEVEDTLDSYTQLAQNPVVLH